MKTLRKTKIVGTIGPASENRLEELINAGLNVTRINYSHGSWDEQSEKTEEIIRLRKRIKCSSSIIRYARTRNKNRNVSYRKK